VIAPVLDRFHALAVDLLGDDRGSRNLELVAFAAHRLDEDREVQFPATAHIEDVGGRPVLHPQCHIGEQLAFEPRPQLSRGAADRRLAAGQR